MAKKKTDTIEPTTRELVDIPIDQLHHDPANVRKHNARNLATIKASLARFGQQKPIVVDQDNIVRAGNGTLEAARELGWATLSCIRSHLTGSEATAYAIADNRSAELAEWDDEGLAETLRALQSEDFDLAAVGFDDGEVDALIDGLASEMVGGEGSGEDPGAQVDKADELQKKWQTATGQLWEIGRHRLAVGDCRDAGLIKKLMRGSRAKLLFTDPPYNQAEHRDMGVGELRPNSYGTLSDSSWDKGFKFKDAEAAILGMLDDECSAYVCMSEFIAGDVWGWMSGWSDYFSYCVWVKSNPMPSLTKKRWTWATELIAYATRGKLVFNFPEDGHALNWWDINVEQANRQHPTQKPVAVPSRAIVHSSNPGDLVVDPFSGSGSTMVASEQLGRSCFGCEISPVYAAVILERLSGMGLTPKLV